MTQEKRYLCVQILTHVVVVVFLLLWKGEQDSEFSINFYFLFIFFRLLFEPVTAVLPFRHTVSAENLGVKKADFLTSECLFVSG